MHPSEKIQRILNQSLKCSYAQTEVICSLYVHYVTARTTSRAPNIVNVQGNVKGHAQHHTGASEKFGPSTTVENSNC